MPCTTTWGRWLLQHLRHRRRHALHRLGAHRSSRGAADPAALGDGAPSTRRTSKTRVARHRDVGTMATQTTLPLPAPCLAPPPADHLGPLCRLHLSFFCLSSAQQPPRSHSGTHSRQALRSLSLPLVEGDDHPEADRPSRSSQVIQTSQRCLSLRHLCHSSPLPFTSVFRRLCLLYLCLFFAHRPEAATPTSSALSAASCRTGAASHAARHGAAHLVFGKDVRDERVRVLCPSRRSSPRTSSSGRTGGRPTGASRRTRRTTRFPRIRGADAAASCMAGKYVILLSLSLRTPAGHLEVRSRPLAGAH